MLPFSYCNGNLYTMHNMVPSFNIKTLLLSGGTELQWENSLQFTGENYASLANIFMAEIETPSVRKHYINDVFSLWELNKTEADLFME